MHKIKSGFIFVLFAFLFANSAYGAEVNLTIKNEEAVVYTSTVPLRDEGIASIAETNGALHDVNARSVLTLVYDTDALTSNYSITDLKYYSSFNAFYLRCINAGKELCDEWLYKINGVLADVGMDNKILAGGEEVVLYYKNDVQPFTPSPSALPAVVQAPLPVIESVPAPALEPPVIPEIAKVPETIIEKTPEPVLAPKPAPKLGLSKKENKIALAEPKAKPKTKPKAEIIAQGTNLAQSNSAASVLAVQEDKSSKKENIFSRFFHWLFR